MARSAQPTAAPKPKKTSKSAKPAKPRGTMAERADRYDLYLRSVQVPEHEAVIFQRFFRSVFKRPASRLREDFCGAAAVSTEWVRRGKDRWAIGVDLDPEPISWGLEHLAPTLPAAARERLVLVRGDVLEVKTPKVDIVAAQNFSFMLFEERKTLLRYFRAAHAALDREGLFVLDMFGGPDVMNETEEVRPLKGFSYVWEQRSFDPVTHHAEYAIHFRFPDGSAIQDAFTYAWRLWTLPEVKDLLLEAGFRRVDVYWEGTTRSGKGDGKWRKVTRADNDPAWVAYLVAVK